MRPRTVPGLGAWRVSATKSVRAGACAGVSVDRPGSVEIPTFSECVVGYRAWLLDAEGRLWPTPGQWPAVGAPGQHRAR
jgi:hypothetical protein